MRFKKMSYQHMLYLLSIGKYAADPDTGAIYNKHNRLLKPFHRPDQQHLFVRLFDHELSSSIGVGRLVWMSVTKEVIPNGWQIHHRDEDPSNNAWNNLLCLHPLDHLKIHDKQPIPF